MGWNSSQTLPENPPDVLRNHDSYQSLYALWVHSVPAKQASHFLSIKHWAPWFFQKARLDMLFVDLCYQRTGREAKARTTVIIFALFEKQLDRDWCV